MSSANTSPLKKRNRFDSAPLLVSEKQTIVNLYKAMASNPKETTTNIVSVIVSTVGVASSTVYRILKEYKTNGDVAGPVKSGGRPSLLKTFDECVKVTVRQIIHSFFFKNELPTLDKILGVIKTREDLPQISRSSLHKLMLEINFKYVKRTRKSYLTERDDIIRWRCKYLREIKEIRKERRPIFYLDETWVNEGHVKDKVWVDDSIKSHRQAFVNNLSSGLKNPTGKGKRLIILHIGSADGFVDGGLLLFESKKTVDYHEEMNSTVFETWFQNILKKLPDNAVIIMDNASYHSRKVDRVPTSASKKAEMQSWLASKNIGYDENMVRSELLHLIKMHKQNFNSYVVDECAKQESKYVLRLPPYHCELNPIELIWAQVKNEVASKNNTFKLKDVQNLLTEAISNVSTENWKKCEEHVIKEEEKMCRLDGIVDNLIESIIIPLDSNSSASSSEYESS